MMTVADPTLCIQLASASKWTTLYWWNYDAKAVAPDGKTPQKWHLDSKKSGLKSVPAYNFDFLFERLRPVFLTQGDAEQLDAFKVLLAAPNPANSLCKLATGLAESGLFK